ncbi:MAG: alpha-ketoglutarate-dependent dioxygenase AlkB [Sediminibacterium sp.]|nr:MAG: 2OG-Fe(II) [Chitinophagaceae bacterium]MDP1844074.1 alpha-ketoglutarate-dependent dioxygenase AlkB [Sediminibacterium sp.]TXT34531.1 MAG: 2OG-Fe(II) oxygenase [Chitinophagaceae bacterium]
MDLFSIGPDATINLLPQDGVVNYYGKIFPHAEANTLLAQLMHTIEWKNDEAFIYGKRIVTKRKVAWYGSKAFPYTYSKTTKTALLFNDLLLQIKQQTESLTGELFNSCLLNLYHTGEEGMAWHSDAEKELKKNGAIASLSFGAERKFAFKHKTTQEKVEVFLEHGSLLVMKGTTQTHWLHRLPPTKLVHQPRVNLTFRFINE